MKRVKSAMVAFQFITSTFAVPALAQHITKEPNVGEKPSRVHQVYSNTRPVCIGRYVIDVPSTAEVAYGPANAPYAIERLPGEAVRFLDIVQEIVRDAESRKSPFAIGPASAPGSKVGTVVKGFSDRQKIVYGVDSSTGAFYQFHSVVVVGNDVYVQHYSFFGEVSELGKIEEELKSIGSHIVPRNSELPLAKSGVCIDGAFVVDGGHSHHEMSTLGVRLREFADVHFSLEMIFKTRLIDSDALEPRLRSAEELAKAAGNGDWYARIKHLRRGERRIANWTGFEALLRRPPQGKYGSFHEFAFVSQGEPNNLALPVLTLDLYTGVEGNTLGGLPSLTDDEVIELWDRLTGSIRPIVADASQ
jgi:hypothetical protein